MDRLGRTEFSISKDEPNIGQDQQSHSMNPIYRIMQVEGIYYKFINFIKQAPGCH